MQINQETGEVLSETALALSKAMPLDFANKNTHFIHVRNDCSASGGCFKVGSTVIAKSMSCALIAVRAFKDTPLFTKKGQEPQPKDWVQVLFVDEKHGNLKSTLIKTRSISGFIGLIQSALAVDKNPVGMSFTMRFADSEGENEKGEKFKYKFIEFEQNDSDSPYKDLATETYEKIQQGLLDYPNFDNAI